MNFAIFAGPFLYLYKLYLYNKREIKQSYIFSLPEAQIVVTGRPELTYFKLKKKVQTIMPKTLEQRIKEIIKSIPEGRVATYGQIAAFAGNPLAARQVVRVLHACSATDKLPWQRVINSKGTISLPPGRGYEMQKALLKREGIEFSPTDRIDLDKFLWQPRKRKN